jgi:hypothetical protein
MDLVPRLGIQAPSNQVPMAGNDGLELVAEGFNADALASLGAHTVIVISRRYQHFIQ